MSLFIALEAGIAHIMSISSFLVGSSSPAEPVDGRCLPARRRQRNIFVQLAQAGQF